MKTRRPPLATIAALLCALQFAALSCSTTGTKHADAYALDVTTEPAAAEPTATGNNEAHTTAQLEPAAPAEQAPELPGQIAAIRTGARDHYRERRNNTATPPPHNQATRRSLARNRARHRRAWNYRRGFSLPSGARWFLSPLALEVARRIC